MDEMNENAIAILGGTGDQGLGLALRFAKAGRPVVIGSRKLDRAPQAADEGRAAVPAGAAGGRPMRPLGVWQGSCAELVEALVPAGVAVVAAFQNVSAHRLREL